MVRETYTVAETANLLGISLNAAYEGVRTGDIPSFRVGKRILVPRGAMNKMLGLNEDVVTEQSSKKQSPKKSGCLRAYQKAPELPWR